jgi:hypothetical protein
MGVTPSNVLGITPAAPAEHLAIGREPRGVRGACLSGIGRGSMRR